MQPQYSQGAAPSHQPPPYAPPEVSQTNGGSTTSSLRQWRKKDYVEKQPSTEPLPTSVGENPSHVARVAPHTYYPRPANDLCHYQHQYAEYSVPYKPSAPAPVKYSEIVENQQAQTIEHITPMIPKHKDKEYVDLCNVAPQPHLKQYPDHMALKQPYPETVKQTYSDPTVHHQYISKDSQMHSFLQKQSQMHQYMQKEPYQQFLPKYNMQGQYPQSYPSEPNNFLAHLNKINPRMAQSIINDAHLRDSQIPIYHNLDQGRSYPQQRMYQAPMHSSPTHSHRNIAQAYNYAQPYNYNVKSNMQPSDPYNRVHQYQHNVPKYIPDYKMNEQPMPNISPQRMYNESVHMNYAPMPPKISPNYPHCGQLEYAQHYQHRRQIPQEYYSHPAYKSSYVQNPQVSPEDISADARTQKSSLKQYLENWVEEDLSGNLPDIIVSNNLSDVENMESLKGTMCIKGSDTQEQPLYVLDTTEIANESLPHFLHLQQFEKLPDNIRGYYHSANAIAAGGRRIIIENTAGSPNNDGEAVEGNSAPAVAKVAEIFTTTVALEGNKTAEIQKKVCREKAVENNVENKIVQLHIVEEAEPPILNVQPKDLAADLQDTVIMEPIVNQEKEGEAGSDCAIEERIPEVGASVEPELKDMDETSQGCIKSMPDIDGNAKYTETSEDAASSGTSTSTEEDSQSEECLSSSICSIYKEMEHIHGENSSSSNNGESNSSEDLSEGDSQQKEDTESESCGKVDGVDLPAAEEEQKERMDTSDISAQTIAQHSLVSNIEKVITEDSVDQTNAVEIPLESVAKAETNDTITKQPKENVLEEENHRNVSKKLCTAKIATSIMEDEPEVEVPTIHSNETVHVGVAETSKSKSVIATVGDVLEKKHTKKHKRRHSTDNRAKTILQIPNAKDKIRRHSAISCQSSYKDLLPNKDAFTNHFLKYGSESHEKPVIESEEALTDSQASTNEKTMPKIPNLDVAVVECCKATDLTVATPKEANEKLALNKGTNEEVATKEACEEVATTEASEEVATKEASEEVASEEASEEVATKETREKVATKETNVEVAPKATREEVAPTQTNEEVATKETREEVATKETREQVATKETNLEVAPKATREEIAPTQTNEEVTTKETKEVATKQTKEEVATKDTREEVATKETSEKVAPTQTNEEVTTKKTRKEVTTKESRKEVATKETSEKVAPTQTNEEVTTKKARKEVATKESRKEVATKESRKEVATKESRKEVATKETSEKVAPTQTNEEVATKNTRKDVATKETSEKVALTQTNREVAIQKTKEEAMDVPKIEMREIKNGNGKLKDLSKSEFVAARNIGTLTEEPATVTKKIKKCVRFADDAVEIADDDYMQSTTPLNLSMEKKRCDPPPQVEYCHTESADIVETICDLPSKDALPDKSECEHLEAPKLSPAISLEPFEFVECVDNKELDFSARIEDTLDINFYLEDTCPKTKRKPKARSAIKVDKLKKKSFKSSHRVQSKEKIRRQERDSTTTDMLRKSTRLNKHLNEKKKVLDATNDAILVTDDKKQNESSPHSIEEAKVPLNDINVEEVLTSPVDNAESSKLQPINTEQIEEISEKPDTFEETIDQEQTYANKEMPALEAEAPLANPSEEFQEGEASVVYQINDSNVVLQIADELLQINITAHNGRRVILVKTFSDALIMNSAEEAECPVLEDESAVHTESAKGDVQEPKADEVLNNNYIDVAKSEDNDFPLKEMCDGAEIAADVCIYNEEVVSSSTEVESMPQGAPGKEPAAQKKYATRKSLKRDKVVSKDLPETKCLDENPKVDNENQKPSSIKDSLRKVPKTKAALKFVESALKPSKTKVKDQKVPCFKAADAEKEDVSSAVAKKAVKSSRKRQSPPTKAEISSETNTKIKEKHQEKANVKPSAHNSHKIESHSSKTKAPSKTNESKTREKSSSEKTKTINALKNPGDAKNEKKVHKSAKPLQQVPKHKTKIDLLYRASIESPIMPKSKIDSFKKAATPKKTSEETKNKKDNIKMTEIIANLNKPEDHHDSTKESNAPVTESEADIQETPISVQENSITSSTSQDTEAIMRERSNKLIQQIADDWEDDSDDLKLMDNSCKRRLSLQEYNDRKRSNSSMEQEKPQLCDLEKTDLTSNLLVTVAAKSKRDVSPESPLLSVKFNNKTYSRNAYCSKGNVSLHSSAVIDYKKEEPLSSAIELQLPKINRSQPKPMYNQEYLRNALMNDLHTVNALTTTLIKENQQLMQRFLEQQRLTPEELKKVKQIIRYKRLVHHLTTLKINEIQASNFREHLMMKHDTNSNKEQSRLNHTATQPLLEESLTIPFKKINPDRRKRKRFRFLYSDEETESNDSPVFSSATLASDEPQLDKDCLKRPRLDNSVPALDPKVMDYSVHQSNSQGQLTLVFKRSFKTDPKMQPFVKLERLSSIDQLARDKLH